MFAWSLAVRNLKRRKLRTALTASGIVKGRFLTEGGSGEIVLRKTLIESNLGADS